MLVGDSSAAKAAARRQLSSETRSDSFSRARTYTHMPRAPFSLSFAVDWLVRPAVRRRLAAAVAFALSNGANEMLSKGCQLELRGSLVVARRARMQISPFSLALARPPEGWPTNFATLGLVGPS